MTIGQAPHPNSQETSSIFADQKRPRIGAQMRGTGVSASEYSCTQGVDEQRPQKGLHSDADIVFVYMCLHVKRRRLVRVQTACC
jgi:hypothetical protein